MKMWTKATLALMALGTSAAFIIAQDNGTPPGGAGSTSGGPPGGPTGANPPGPWGPGFRHHRLPPIIAALDTNRDGVIDANEIANAPAALKTLDKNGDGKLTMDELMPPPPMRDGGPPPPPDDEPPPPGGN